MRQDSSSYHDSLKGARLIGESLLGVSLKTHCMLECDKNLHEFCMDKFQDLIFFIKDFQFFEIEKDGLFPFAATYFSFIAREL